MDGIDVCLSGLLCDNYWAVQSARDENSGPPGLPEVFLLPILPFYVCIQVGIASLVRATFCPLLCLPSRDASLVTHFCTDPSRYPQWLCFRFFVWHASKRLLLTGHTFHYSPTTVSKTDPQTQSQSQDLEVTSEIGGPCSKQGWKSCVIKKNKLTSKFHRDRKKKAISLKLLLHQHQDLLYLNDHGRHLIPSVPVIKSAFESTQISKNAKNRRKFALRKNAYFDFGKVKIN